MHDCFDRLPHQNVHAIPTAPLELCWSFSYLLLYLVHYINCKNTINTNIENKDLRILITPKLLFKHKIFVLLCPFQMKKQSCLNLIMKKKKGTVVKRKFIFLHACNTDEKSLIESACLFKPFQATITQPYYRTSVRIQRISGMQRC